MRIRFFGLCFLFCLPVWAGCSRGVNEPYMTPDRQDRGMVIILPGIEGQSYLNERLREGLTRAGTPYAQPIWKWGSQIPIVKLAMNEMDVEGNRASGMKLAAWVARYEDQYPGRPVYLVGHSGGGGVAVFAAEALARMPGKRKLTGMILLSPSISASYDLTEAMQACELGIVAFYNETDLGLLGLGTTLVGNMDGGHGSSAGRVGFRALGAADPETKKLAYRKLYQVETNSGMVNILTAHSDDTQATFVRKYVAPWILSEPWPPAAQVALSR